MMYIEMGEQVVMNDAEKKLKICESLNAPLKKEEIDIDEFLSSLEKAIKQEGLSRVARKMDREPGNLQRSLNRKNPGIDTIFDSIEALGLEFELVKREDNKK